MDFEERVNVAVKEMVSRGYTPKAFMTMRITHGTVEAIKKLINSTAVPDGFTRLWELGKLDLSMENIIQEKEWCDLFTEDDRLNARKRLKAYNFVSHIPLDNP